MIDTDWFGLCLILLSFGVIGWVWGISCYRSDKRRKRTIEHWKVKAKASRERADYYFNEMQKWRKVAVGVGKEVVRGGCDSIW